MQTSPALPNAQLGDNRQQAAQDKAMRAFELRHTQAELNKKGDGTKWREGSISGKFSFLVVLCDVMLS